MHELISYLHERFPVIQAFIFSISYCGFALGVIGNNTQWHENTGSIFFIFITLTFMFYFFLLRQRVVDEFRDKKHDATHFPSRPYSRGAITKKTLIILGLVSMSIEIVAVILLGWKSALLYLIPFSYSLLMVKEFFISTFLEKHFTFSFLIHECIFTLFGLFFLVAIPHSNIQQSTVFLQMLVLTVAPMGIEIVRKFSARYDPRGNPVKDSYSVVWGTKTTLYILIIISILLGIATSIIKQSSLFFVFSLIISLSFFFFVPKNEKNVVILEGIFFVSFALLTNIL